MRFWIVFILFGLTFVVCGAESLEHLVRFKKLHLLAIIPMFGSCAGIWCMWRINDIRKKYPHVFAKLLNVFYNLYKLIETSDDQENLKKFIGSFQLTDLMMPYNKFKEKFQK